MIWGAIRYDWPSMAILLAALLPLAWSMVLLYRYRQKKLKLFADWAVRNAVVENREPVLYWVKVLLYCLAWIGGVIAVMQPKGNERYVSTAPNGEVTVIKQRSKNHLMRKKTHEVIFLVDASASMKIPDISGKTRLEVSKEIVDDIISHLKGENVSLFAFTSATMQIVPSTLDYLFTRLMLQQIEINEGETEGTDIKLALEFVRKLYFAQPSSKTKTLILLTDGGDTSLYELNPEQRKEEVRKIVDPIRDAEEKNLRVLVVGVAGMQGKDVPGITFQGKPVISSLDEALLRKISSSGRGSLFIIGEMTAFQISQAIAQNIARDESFIDVSQDEPPDMGERSHVYDLYFQIPLGIAILALAGCLLIPDTRKSIGERQ